MTAIMVAFYICCYVTGSGFMRLKLLPILIALALIPASCSNTALPRLEVTSYMEKLVHTGIPLKMDIEFENGKTEVYSWNRNEVKFEITKIIRGNETKKALLKRLEDFNIAIDREAGRLALKCRFRNGNSKAEGLVKLKLYIPKKTSSFSLVQKNGSITFLDDFDGDMDINAEKLDLNINRLEGKLTCMLEKGDLRVASGELETDSSATISIGNIRIKASFESPGSYNFRTNYGILELCIPQSTNAVFDTFGLLEAGDFDPGDNPSKFRLESKVGKISILKF